MSCTNSYIVTTYTIQVENDSNDSKHYANNGCYNLGNADPTVHPDRVTPTDSLNSAPEPVSQVEPQSYVPYQIQHCIQDITLEIVVDNAAPS